MIGGGRRLLLSEIAGVLVCLNHVARFIVNAKSRHRASGTPEDSFSGLIDRLARARCPKNVSH